MIAPGPAIHGVRHGRRRLEWMALAAVLAIPSCAGPRVPPHPHLDRMWRQYVELPDERAMVVGGDPRRLWVGASAAGAQTMEEAVERATVACKARRVARRVPGLCRTYALGDEIVWEDN